MSDRARRAFAVYVDLGPSRTLAKVADVYAQRSESISLVTLKRWSAHYKWRSFIKQHEQIVAGDFYRKVWAKLFS